MFVTIVNITGYSNVTVERRNNMVTLQFIKRLTEFCYFLQLRKATSE